MTPFIVFFTVKTVIAPDVACFWKTWAGLLKMEAWPNEKLLEKALKRQILLQTVYLDQMNHIPSMDMDIWSTHSIHKRDARNWRFFCDVRMFVKYAVFRWRILLCWHATYQWTRVLHSKTISVYLTNKCCHSEVSAWVNERW